MMLDYCILVTYSLTVSGINVAVRTERVSGCDGGLTSHFLGSGDVSMGRNFTLPVSIQASAHCHVLGVCDLPSGTYCDFFLR